MEREITTHEKGIVELVNMLAGKRLLIPPFQREFVWEPEDVLKFWDSVFRYYPIGSLLSWETPTYLRIHRRAGGKILPGMEYTDCSSSVRLPDPFPDVIPWRDGEDIAHTGEF